MVGLLFVVVKFPKLVVVAVVDEDQFPGADDPRPNEGLFKIIKIF